MRNDDQPMTRGQWVGFFLVGITLILIPIQLSWAIWGGGVLVLYSLVLFFLGGCKVPKEGRKEVLLVSGTFLLYFLWHLVAMLWTGNPSEGWATIGRKWFFVLFPVVFLLADWSWLRGRRLRQLLYCFLFSLVALFLVRLSIGIYQCLFEEASWVRTLFIKLDPVHHNYMSLYLLFGIAFCYNELVQKPRRLSWHLCLTVCLLLLVLFMVFKYSRGGLLTLGAMLVVILYDLMFRRRQWKVGVLVALSSVALMVGAKYMIPEERQRMVATINKLSDGKGDTRLIIYKGSLRCIAERPLLGYGTGNVNAPIYAQFEAVGEGADDPDARLNCHSIYFQSWLAGGVVGFVLLLALLGLPLWIAVRQRNYLLAMLVLIYAVGGVVESLYERQMAILFYSLLCFVLLPMRGDENPITPSC